MKVNLCSCKNAVEVLVVEYSLQSNNWRTVFTRMKFTTTCMSVEVNNPVHSLPNFRKPSVYVFTNNIMLGFLNIRAFIPMRRYWVFEFLAHEIYQILAYCRFDKYLTLKPQS